MIAHKLSKTHQASSKQLSFPIAFTVGTRVVCNCAPKRGMTGTVKKSLGLIVFVEWDDVTVTAISKFSVDILRAYAKR